MPVPSGNPGLDGFLRGLDQSFKRNNPFIKKRESEEDRLRLQKTLYDVELARRQIQSHDQNMALQAHAIESARLKVQKQQQQLKRAEAFDKTLGITPVSQPESNAIKSEALDNDKSNNSRQDGISNLIERGGSLAYQDVKFNFKGKNSGGKEGKNSSPSLEESRMLVNLKRRRDRAYGKIKNFKIQQWRDENPGSFDEPPPMAIEPTSEEIELWLVELDEFTPGSSEEFGRIRELRELLREQRLQQNSTKGEEPGFWGKTVEFAKNFTAVSNPKKLLPKGTAILKKLNDLAKEREKTYEDNGDEEFSRFKRGEE